MQKRRLNEPKLFIGRVPGPPEMQRSCSSKKEPAAAKGRTTRNLAISTNSQSRHHNSEARPERRNDDQIHPSARGWARSFLLTQETVPESVSLNRLEATLSTEQEGQQFRTRVSVTSERKGPRRETFKLPPDLRFEVGGALPG